MKTAAIISEYNPFHNGHAYLINKIRETVNADRIISIMSGNYVQRGEPALFDKYIRANAALLCGSDLVIEIPTVFSTASADEFAAAGISVAKSLGIVDFLCFGIECGNYSEEFVKEKLLLLSSVIGTENETTEFSANMKLLLKSGKTYPAAVFESLSYCMKDKSELQAMQDILTFPNNILALSYLRFLKGSGIEPVMIKRTGDGYAEMSHIDNRCASASSIRKSALKSESDFINDINSYTPDVLNGLYSSRYENIVFPDNVSTLLNFRLLNMNLLELRLIESVSDEIAGRIDKDRKLSLTFTERVLSIKTRQYTYSRISRALLHIVLGITKAEHDNLKINDYVPYIRILGLNTSCGGFLSQIKKSCKKPLISNAYDCRDILSRDIYFDNIYYMLNNSKTELEHSPIILQ